MLDESIPLTTNEYDEWGNPADRRCYDYLLSYSPYDNVRAQAYPAMLVTTGLWDSQVQYYEPAKWVAKLRSAQDRPKSSAAARRHGGRPRRQIRPLSCAIARPRWNTPLCWRRSASTIAAATSRIKKSAASGEAESRRPGRTKPGNNSRVDSVNPPRGRRSRRRSRHVLARTSSRQGARRPPSRASTRSKAN